MRQLLLTAVAAVTVLVGATAPLLILTAGRAHASTQWTFTDTVETTAALWSFDGTPGDSGGRLVDDATKADTGSHFFRIDATGAGAFSSVGRPVRLPAGATTCRMAMRVDPHTWASSPSEPDWFLRLNLEVINPADWTYVALTPITMYPSDYVWITRSTGIWRPAVRDVFVRVSVLGETSGGRFVMNLNVDTLKVYCTVGT